MSIQDEWDIYVPWPMGHICPKSHKPIDSNIELMQALMQPFMQAMQQQSQVFMEKITEKISGMANWSNADDRGSNRGNKKINTKGHRPEKLEREIGYAKFLQWEKSWKLYMISDNVGALSEQQQTAILYSFFSKELLSNLECQFKINIDVQQKVGEVIEAKGTKSAICTQRRGEN